MRLEVEAELGLAGSEDSTGERRLGGGRGGEREEDRERGGAEANEAEEWAHLRDRLDGLQGIERKGRRSDR